MEFIAAFLFALAVSADGFLVGIAYGAKKIRIPILPLCVIAISSAAAVTLSMVLGSGLATFISPRRATIIGSILLVFIGIYFWMGAFREKIHNMDGSEEEPIATFSIKCLGIIVKILKEPSSADLDSSGEISLREAMFLGVALALDALGAGVGLAMTGLNIFLTALLVGVLKFILVNTGIQLGSTLGGRRLKEKASLLSGCIFIGIGIMQIL